MRLMLCTLALGGFVFSLGCGMDLAKKDEDRRAAGGIGGTVTGNLLDSPAPSAPTQPQPEPTAEQPGPTEPAAAEATSAEPAPATTASGEPTVGAPSEDPNVDRVAAKRGVGKTGRIEGSGMVVTPIKAYFLTKQRTELEIKLPHAMNLYKAEHGNFPKTQEEFMRDIIELNQIKLPELPAGHRYVYEPKTGELMVERPQQ